MQQQEPIDDGLQAWAGVGGVALVLTLGLSALWAVGANDAPTPIAAVSTPLVADVQDTSPAVALYEDEGGAHDKPATPAPETPTTTSLFDTR